MLYAQVVQEDESALWKFVYNGSWMYFSDPSGPLTFDLIFSLQSHSYALYFEEDKLFLQSLSTAFSEELSHCFIYSSVEIIPAFDYMAEGPNGTLTYIGAQLMNGEADLGTAPSVFLPYRMKHLTFLHPMDASR
jgi:hypothetical protein